MQFTKPLQPSFYRQGVRAVADYPFSVESLKYSTVPRPNEEPVSDGVLNCRRNKIMSLPHVTLLLASGYGAGGSDDSVGMKTTKEVQALEAKSCFRSLCAITASTWCLPIQLHREVLMDLLRDFLRDETDFVSPRVRSPEVLPRPKYPNFIHPSSLSLSHKNTRA